MARRWVSLFALIANVLLIDQLTKRIVLATLSPGDSVNLIPFLSPFFRITYIENTGSAFGFLPQAGDLFLIIALVVVISLIIFYPRVPPEAVLTRRAVGFVAGGALGNALDRILHGAVIDFIHYSIPGVFSNVSNLADHAIVLGVLLLIVDSWRPKRPPAVEQAHGDAPDDAV